MGAEREMEVGDEESHKQLPTACDLLHLRPPRLVQLACRYFPQPAAGSVPVAFRILV